ncbi:MAG TPA: DUF2284 domain-containing protein [Deferrisomatales bacterium]|nr:DUF2284 domain-containing protein [Deferrisomatales bacterium]
MHVRMDPSEVLTLTLPDGSQVNCQRHAARVATGSIRGEDAVKRACEPCPNFANNFGCPPHSPFFDAWAATAPEALLICLQASPAVFPAASSAERMLRGGRVLQGALYAELLAWREKGHLVAGAGPCRGCERCALADGGLECVAPEAQVCSLESMGVNVVALAKEVFGIELEWGDAQTQPATVVAIGGVFSAAGPVEDPERVQVSGLGRTGSRDWSIHRG